METGAVLMATYGDNQRWRCVPVRKISRRVEAVKELYRAIKVITINFDNSAANLEQRAR